MQKKIFLSIVAMAFLAMGLLPVLSMFLGSLFENNTFSLNAYKGILTSVHQWTLMGNSLALSFTVATFTTLLGVPLGVVLGKTDLPLQRLLSVLFMIPLLIPPYIVAVAWSDLLQARHMVGFGGCVLVLFSCYLPIPTLLTMVFLRTINPGLEEAARLTSGWTGVLSSITLPLIAPGILLGVILVFLLTFGQFGVPNFLRYEVFPVESFTQFSAFYNFEAATAASLPLALVTFFVLVLEARFLRDRTYELRPIPMSRNSTIIELGKAKISLFCLVGVLAIVLVIVPLAALLVQSAQAQAYVQAVRKAGASLVRSMVYSFWGATLLTLMGFFTGYIIHTKALGFWRALDSVSVFLFALPATVIGIGLISLWNTTWTNFIYATSLIIILGYLIKYTALTSRIMVTQFAQIPVSLQEASQVCGAGWARTMLFIVAPLAKRGLLAGWLVGYVFSMRDTAIVMLVYPPGHETLPVRIFTLMANGSSQLIAALCVLMVGATILPVGILWSIPKLIAKRGFL